MAYYITKVIITTVLIVSISEISKRSSLIGALLASIPLVSVLAMIWLYIDTKNVDKITQLSKGVFWLVLPSLPLFLILPALLKKGVNFYLSLGVSLVIMVSCYLVMVAILNKYGIKV